MKRNLRVPISIAGFAIAGFLLYRVWSSFDWSATLSTLSMVAPWKILLLLFPFAIEVSVDCIAWRHLLPREYKGVSFGKMFKARTGPEAIFLTFPLGPLISEPLKGWLLYKFIGLKTSIGMVSVILRSCFLVLGQCTFVIVMTALNFGWIQGLSSGVIHQDGLAYLLLIVAGSLFLGYEGFLLVASRKSFIKKLHDKLEHARFALLRKVWHSTENYIGELNSQFSTFGSERKKSVLVAYFLYILSWVFQATETFLILTVLGADIPILQVFAIEAACGFLRSVAFIVPSGLGVEDAAYFLMFNASGVSHPLSAAFIIMKRLRELLWVSLGYSILFTSGFSFKKTYSETAVPNGEVSGVLTQESA